jgi:chitodextrinase
VRAYGKRVGGLFVRILLLVLSAGGFCEANAAIASLQTVAKAAPGTASSWSASFPANTAAGDLILVAFDFDTNSTPSSVTDAQSNTFIEVGSQLTSPAGSRSRVYYAKNIKGGADTVTVNLSSSSGWIELYLTEYSGADPTNPIDAQAGSSGNAGAVSSGSATTTVAGDAIYGYCVGDYACTAGSGFTARSTFNGNLIEDMTAGNPGSYAATGSANRGWTMQMVALKPSSASDTTPPSVPTNLSATAVSSSQINLAWTASTDNVGVAGYRVFRNGALIGTTTATSYTDTNLAASTTYSYAVAAYDAAGNVSAQSTPASATTSPSSDTVPPSVPTNLSGTSPLATEVSLSWSASTDNVGVAGYKVFRNSSQVATTTTTSYLDTGLVASTTYTYTVAAFDAAGNVSAASSPFVITTTAAASGPAYPLKVSNNGRYLVNQNNQPVFILGDTGWALITQLDNADAATYLADRASRGMNIISVAAADNIYQTNAPEDFYGNVPFDGADFTNFDSVYWAHVDSIVQLAQSYGITLMINPAFVGLNSSDGYINSYLNSSDATVTAYGTFLGNRYKGSPNIIWQLGGDSNTGGNAGLTQKMTDLATGIAAADPNHLITYEACPVGVCGVGSNSSLDIFSGASWLGLNADYTQYGQAQSQCAVQYAKSPFLPPFQFEDWFELEHSMTELQLREEAYWEILSGCYVGRLFGNNAIWTFNSTYQQAGDPTWQSQLSSVGSVGQQYLGQLMRSREHWLMVPDTSNTVLTAGFGSGTTISVASRTSDGQTVMAYIPNGNATTVTINMASITSASSTANEWWYNPQTAVTTMIGTSPNSGSQSFTPPDSNDWVLVIDAASANLPAPGTPLANPLPFIVSLNPATIAAGGPTFTLTVNGAGFVQGSVVNFNGTAKATTFVSTAQLTASILATDIATSGTANVTVKNPAPGGGTTSNFSFVISGASNPIPTLTSIAPTSATAGGAAFPLTLNGSNFVAGAQVDFGTNPAITPTTITSTQITATVPAGDIATGGTVNVTVMNPAPGGGASSAQTFTINNIAATITSLNPSTIAAGGAAFTLTLNGTNFVSTSVVNFNGTAMPTTFKSATQLTASISAADIANAGNANVTVTNPPPGGGTTPNFVFVISSASNPMPTLTSIAPASGTLDQSVALTLTGTNFISGSVVNFGSNADAGGVVSNGGDTLTITIPAGQLATAGPINVTVTNAAPGGGTSSAKTFTIDNPAPTLGSIAPTSATAGTAAFTLTVNGAGFASGATVQFNGANRTTTFVSSTKVTAAILAADIVTSGNVNVTVTNPAPTTGPSAPQTFTIDNPAPTVASLGPTHAAGGSAFALTVNGTNFVQMSVVNFNGKAETTTFVNATTLTAAIPASDVSTAGNVNVTVSSPSPGGGTAAASTFTVDGYSVSGPTGPITVTGGQPSMIQISVMPTANGFANPVSFTMSGLPAQFTAAFLPTSVTPDGKSATTILTITNTAGGVALPVSRIDKPWSPLLPLSLGFWIALLLGGLYAGLRVRGTPQLSRYAAILLLGLVLGTGAVLGGCSFRPGGTAVSNPSIIVVATSGTLTQTTQITLSVTK